MSMYFSLGLVMSVSMARWDNLLWNISLVPGRSDNIRLVRCITAAVQNKATRLAIARGGRVMVTEVGNVTIYLITPRC